MARKRKGRRNPPKTLFGFASGSSSRRRRTDRQSRDQEGEGGATSEATHRAAQGQEVSADAPWPDVFGHRLCFVKCIIAEDFSQDYSTVAEAFDEVSRWKTLPDFTTIKLEVRAKTASWQR